MLMGIGMANVLAPCTDSIMGSLPRAKAGVGSAVNDTTRQMGGAVGVAVFGSLMASHFTERDDRQDRRRRDPAAAVRAGERQRRARARRWPRRPPRRGSSPTSIVTAANDSFVSGLHLVAVVAAGITVLAAIGVALFLPARGPRRRERVPVGRRARGRTGSRELDTPDERTGVNQGGIAPLADAGWV